MSPFGAMAATGRFVFLAGLLIGLSIAPMSPNTGFRALVLTLCFALIERGLRAHFETGIAFLTTLTLATSASVLNLTSIYGDWDRLEFFVAGSVVAALTLLSKSSPGRRAGALVGTVLAVAPAVIEAARSAAWSVSFEDVLVGLFGSPSGLIYATPLLWLGIIGGVLAREVPAARLGAFAILGGVAGLAITTSDTGLHPRVESWIPFFAPGIAWCLTRLRDFTRHSPRVAVAALSLPLVGWNMPFLEQYRQHLLPADETVSFARVTSNSASLVSRYVGTPSAWPANWIFTLRYRTRPDRWDALAGRRLIRRGADSGTVEIGDDPSLFAPDSALLINGFGDRRTCGQGWCRDMGESARIFLPVYDVPIADLVIRIRVRGGGVLTLSLNDTAHAATQLNDSLEDAILRVPARALHRGINVLALSLEKDQRATLDRLTIERVASPSAN